MSTVPKRFVAIDLESAKPFPSGANWRDHRPLGISCAVTVSPFESIPWFGQLENGQPADQMVMREASQLVDYLLQANQNGYVITTWNGMGFDWPVLAEASGRIKECRYLSWNHVDMMYHLFCTKGYPLKLNVAATGMDVGQKTEGISGAEAPILWAQGEHQRVLDYCTQDTALTMALAELCQERAELLWTSSAGRSQRMILPEGWLTVAEASKLPLPDNRWMTNPVVREDIIGWLS